MLKSTLFWTSLLLCLVAFCGILFYRTNQQPQEPQKKFKYVPAEQRASSPISDKSVGDTKDDHKETDVVPKPINSGELINAEDLTSSEGQLTEAETDSEKTILPTNEAQGISEPKEERIFGLTFDEIKEEIPVLEKEIRTNLTKAVELYTELRSTDGMAAKSAEIAAWRDETWKEVQQLFYDVSRTGKIMRYTSFLKVVGEEQNPLLPGGWISDLMEPLPMRVTVGTSQ